MTHGADIHEKGYSSSNLLKPACDSKQVEIALFLMNQGIDIHALDDDANNPLIWACYNNEPTITRQLLERGVNVNHCNKSGDSALIIATLNGSLMAVEILGEWGADFKIKNKSNQNALKIAEGMDNFYPGNRWVGVRKYLEQIEHLYLAKQEREELLGITESSIAKSIAKDQGSVLKKQKSI